MSFTQVGDRLDGSPLCDRLRPKKIENNPTLVSCSLFEVSVLADGFGLKTSRIALKTFRDGRSGPWRQNAMTCFQRWEREHLTYRVSQENPTQRLKSLIIRIVLKLTKLLRRHHRKA
jgi:hypothetical protein